MNWEEYKSLYELEEHYWWFRGMREIASALLDPIVGPHSLRALDVGCGTGYTLPWLRDKYSRSEIVVGLDISRDALSFSRRRGETSLIQASVTHLPVANDTFDLVVSFEVLDWLLPQAAAEAFSELTRVLRPGGLLLVRLPAFQWLYSGHDRAILTTHRYTRPELVQYLNSSGLIVVRATYVNSLLFPVAAVWRWLNRSQQGIRSDVRPLPKGLRWTNSLLEGFLKFEARYLRRFDWSFPVGLSVVAVARKPTL